jgi:molecular chaperone GrpE
MLDEQTKEDLIEQFRASLDACEEEIVDTGEALDLHTLLAEMAALKTEVRLQARQFKTAFEQMQALSDALRQHNDRLLQDVERARSQAGDAKAQAERGLLLGLLELRDRLQAGLDAQLAWQPSPLQRVLGSGHRFVQSLCEGSTLTLQRLDELLAKYRVRAIAAVGQALDPHCMHAVGVEWSAQVNEGLVLRELRRGFYQGTELLRAAEVIVNKSKPNEKETAE